ncbi:hypothetical protein EYC84_010127 [Monilinia fructicola]|uniref:Uncharacterized protein n=1 Tax=Monilinia fructicola TaxID=38448 RepID=A0A5M9JIW6_MONFR|nr:hypothetical protein EYC84_010127 [Monilinia fructicola]
MRRDFFTPIFSNLSRLWKIAQANVCQEKSTRFRDHIMESVRCDQEATQVFVNDSTSSFSKTKPLIQRSILNQSDAMCCNPKPPGNPKNTKQPKITT